MIQDVLLSVTEAIGTIAFSISGALVAIHCGLDLLGVMVLGCITAVGGGMIRDVLIGNTPPLIFSNPGTFLLALAPSVIVFVLGYFNTARFQKLQKRISQITNFFDALGLAAFSISGIEIAASAGYADSAGIAIAMGVITGVGGGVLRDVLADVVPSILAKKVYAVVSIFGCSLYYLIRTYTPYIAAGTVIVMVAMTMIRVLATRFCWNLPKISDLDVRENEINANS